MSDKHISYLIDSQEPWVVYNTLVHLCKREPADEQVLKAREAMITHPLVQGLVQELKAWPGQVLSSHKSAGQLYHKLAFLADIGLTADDTGISEILDLVMAHPSEEGVFQLPMNIPTHFGGTGQDQWAWALCDAPLHFYSLVKMKKLTQHDIEKGLAYLMSLVRDNGWPCAVSKELGKFRGPGRKDDPCPYANLLMLKLMSLFEDLKCSEEARKGVRCLLNAWETSLERHPYMFYMGTDFRKLKAPLIWYDILHVVTVLSAFDYARIDPRFQDMLGVLTQKADIHGRYTIESEWKAWKDWDFGKKKKPSPWATYLVDKILKESEVAPEALVKSHL